MAAPAGSTRKGVAVGTTRSATATGQLDLDPRDPGGNRIFAVSYRELLGPRWPGMRKNLCDCQRSARPDSRLPGTLTDGHATMAVLDCGKNARLFFDRSDINSS